MPNQIETLNGNLTQEDDELTAPNIDGEVPNEQTNMGVDNDLTSPGGPSTLPQTNNEEPILERENVITSGVETTPEGVIDTPGNNIEAQEDVESRSGETAFEYIVRMAKERSIERIEQEERDKTRRTNMMLEYLGVDQERASELIQNMEETDRELGGALMRHNAEYIDKGVETGITIAPHEYMTSVTKSISWFDQRPEVLDYFSKHPDPSVRYDAATKFEFTKQDRSQIADEIINLSQAEFEQLSYTERHQLMRVWWQQSRVVLLGYDTDPRPEMDEVKQHLEQLFGLEDLGDREYYNSLLEKVEQEQQQR